MGLRTLTANLTNKEGSSINTSDYPYHATYDGGGSSHGDSKSIFDTKLFQQREFGYGAEISTPLITRNFTSNNNRPLPGVEDNDTWKIEIAGDSGLDIFTSGFIRGGLKTSTQRALTDFNRLRKFFITPKGANFLFKQVALQRMNPKIQEGSVQLLGRDVDFFGNTSRVFNPIHLIPGVNNINEAALTQHTGIFINRAGLSPESYGFEGGYNYDETNPSKYEYTVRSQDKKQPKNAAITDIGYLKFSNFSSGDEEEIQNRLLQLYQLKTFRHTNAISIEDEVSGTAEWLGNLAENIADIFVSSEEADRIGDKVESTVNNIFDILGLGSYPKNGIASDEGFLLLYGGGPASTDGLGQTKVKRYKQDNKGNYIRINVGPYSPLPSPDNISKLTDFRKASNRAIKSINANKPELFANTPKATSYSTQNMQSRINIGNPGNLSIKKESYNVKNDTTIDTLNALDIQKVTNGQHNLAAYRDLIRFRIEAVNTDDPNESESMVFRAFLDGWQDNFNSNWNEFQYNGRAESLYTYGGFKRNIGFQFKIAAQTRHEMKPIYRKLNFLISNLAPDYTGQGNLRMRSPFMRLTIGAHMDRIPGFFNNVNLTWNTNYPYEIAIDSKQGGLDSSMQVLPQVLDVSCQFTPIHNFLPQKGISSPFILSHHNNRTLRGEQRWYEGGASTDNVGGAETFSTGIGAIDNLIDDDYVVTINDTNPNESNIINIE